MKSHIITVDGKLTDYPPKSGKEYTLEELNEAVGGYIEIVDLGDKYMVVNEEGKIKDLPYNQLATHVFRRAKGNSDFIVGNVLVCDKNQIS
jgi:hypothetical protein